MIHILKFKHVPFWGCFFFASAQLLVLAHVQSLRTSAQTANTPTPIGTCGVDINCLTVPSDCTIKEDASCTLISWKGGATDTKFSIQGTLATGATSGWSAISIANGLRMADGDCYMCVKKDSSTSSVTLSSNWMSGRSYPQESDQKDQLTDIQEAFVTFVAGDLAQIQCSFSRPNKLNDGQFTYSTYDLNSGNTFYLLLATGPVDGAGTPTYHNSRLQTSEQLDFLSGVDDDIDVDTDKNYYTLSHATLMYLSWGIIIKISIFTAMFFKNVFEENGLWFQIHRGLNVTVGLLSIVGVILAFKGADWDFYGLTSESSMAMLKNHTWIGITILALMVMNIIGGMLRPDKNDEKKRPLFNNVHRFLGISAMVLADVAIFLGLYVHNDNLWSVGDTIFACVVGLNISVSVGLSVYVSKRGQLEKDDGKSTIIYFGHVFVLIALGGGVISQIYA